MQIPHISELPKIALPATLKPAGGQGKHWCLVVEALTEDTPPRSRARPRGNRIEIQRFAGYFAPPGESCFQPWTPFWITAGSYQHYNSGIVIEGTDDVKRLWIYAPDTPSDECPPWMMLAEAIAPIPWTKMFLPYVSNILPASIKAADEACKAAREKKPTTAPKIAVYGERAIQLED